MRTPPDIPGQKMTLYSCRRKFENEKLELKNARKMSKNEILDLKTKNEMASRVNYAQNLPETTISRPNHVTVIAMCQIDRNDTISPLLRADALVNCSNITSIFKIYQIIAYIA